MMEWLAGHRHNRTEYKVINNEFLKCLFEQHTQASSAYLIESFLGWFRHQERVITTGIEIEGSGGRGGHAMPGSDIERLVWDLLEGG